MRLTPKTAVTFAVAFAGLLTYGDAWAGSVNTITGLDSAESGSMTTLTIGGTETPTFTVYKLESPSRLVIDVAGAELDGKLTRAEGDAQASWNVNSWAVSQVVASARRDRKAQLVRVVVSLARASSYRVKADGNKLVVRVNARESKPEGGASDAELSAARDAAKAAEAKAQSFVAATRLANERARQAEARAAAEAKRASAVTASEAQKRKAEVAKRKAAEARLEAALVEINAAKERAAAAERDVAVAKADADKAKKVADERAAKAAAEAHGAKVAARKESAEAAARLKAAEGRIREATEQAERAGELLAAAEKARGEAARAAADAEARDKSATKALALADVRRAEAEKAEKTAERVREQADRAKATGSAESEALARRAQEAAQSAEKRRLVAETAARAADTRRAEAEKAEREALERSKSTTAAVATAERRRQAADEARVSAEAARKKAELENRDLIATIDSAKTRAKEASNRAEGFVKAAEVARAQAAEARASRLAEERARENAARARVTAETERQRAEGAAAELRQSIDELKRAETGLAKRRRAAKEAADRLSGSSSAERAKHERESAARAAELADAEKALAARQGALATSERKAAEHAKIQDKAAAELTDLKKAAAKARRDREREEKLAAQLEARRKSADDALGVAESRLAEAQKDRERARSAAIAAESARAEAVRQRAAARASRTKADGELRAAEVERQQAAADRKEAAALKEESARLAASRAVENERATAKAKSAQLAADREMAKSKRAFALAKRERLAAERAGQAKAATKQPTVSAARVNDVKFVDKGSSARVVVGLSAPASPKVIKNRGTVAVLEIEGVKMAKDLERTLDTSAFNGPIKAISSYRDPKKPSTVRVVVDLFEPARGVLKKVGNTYYWDFPSSGPARAGRVASTPRADSYGSTKLASSAANAAASTSITQQTVAQLRPGRRRVYRGRRIDLNFKDADIHNLLRLLATVGGVSIVVPQSVTGTVTVSLKSVPWDQAMEVILSSQGLWYRRDGSLIRVAKREILEKEDEDEAKRRAAEIKSEAPEPEIFTLNYADAKNIKAQLGGLVSPKGRIEINDRTNSLIINDIAAHRRRIIDLATRLDTQTPQIQIEARIVEARTTFVREFGIQWGGNAAATPAGGNPTGLVFPNSIDLAGAGDDGNTPTAGVAGVPSNFAVNLPAAIGTGSGGGLGLSLGSVGGNFNINLRLSALEDSGSARIISAPKITVSNNIKARIKSGVSIPISVVSANGTQTQFVPADLSLEVTPKVSQRDCSVSMVVNVTKNEADFANTGARGDPSILTKEATTTILVADGETAVIGGIYTRNTGLNYSKVPFFADIPVIGYFFKNRRENDERSEVLVFVTPKITNRAFLRCE